MYDLTRPRVPTLQLATAIRVINSNVQPMHLETVQSLKNLQLMVFCAAAATASPGGASSCLAMKIGESDLEEACRNWKTDRVPERPNIYKTTSTPAEHRTLGTHQLTEELNTLVQQLSFLAKRLRRYTDSAKRQQQNRMFSDNERVFYDQINQEKPDFCDGLPSIGDVTNFWAGIWEVPVQHRDGQPWLSREEEWAGGEINEMPAVTTPEDKNTSNPSKYRPITCLSSLYKILSSIITSCVWAHCEQNGFLTEEQKGCKKNNRGGKDQAIIDAVIVERAVANQRNLSMACIDYK